MCNGALRLYFFLFFFFDKSERHAQNFSTLKLGTTATFVRLFYPPLQCTLLQKCLQKEKRSILMYIGSGESDESLKLDKKPFHCSHPHTQRFLYVQTRFCIYSMGKTSDKRQWMSRRMSLSLKIQSLIFLFVNTLNLKI